MTTEQIRALATRIADDLMTNERGDSATHLYLYAINRIGDIGHWLKSAAIERIVKVLEEANEQR